MLKIKLSQREVEPVSAILHTGDGLSVFLQETLGYASIAMHPLEVPRLWLEAVPVIAYAQDPKLLGYPLPLREIPPDHAVLPAFYGIIRETLLSKRDWTAEPENHVWNEFAVRFNSFLWSIQQGLVKATLGLQCMMILPDRD